MVLEPSINDYKVIFKEMLDSNLEIGHKLSEWNPQMKFFLKKQEKDLFIIDPVKTYFHTKEVLNFLRKNALLGKNFLFIGTAKSVSPLIPKVALSCKSSYVNFRWLGGMLTNWKTIKKSLKSLKKLRDEENLGDWVFLKKKEIIKKQRQKLRLEKYLGGLENMRILPDIAIIVGQSEEVKIIKECQRLGITTVTILDSNRNPSLSDYFIPMNDDSVRSLWFILLSIRKVILEGQENSKEGVRFFKNNKLFSEKYTIKKHNKYSKIKTNFK